MIINLATTQKRQVIDITEKIESALQGEQEGVVYLFVKHTTAAISIADLDPGTDNDLLKAISMMTPKASWRHPITLNTFPIICGAL